MKHCAIAVKRAIGLTHFPRESNCCDTSDTSAIKDALCCGNSEAQHASCRNMINKLGHVLKQYWWQKMDRLGKSPHPQSSLPPRGVRTRIPQIQAPCKPCLHCLLLRRSKQHDPARILQALARPACSSETLLIHALDWPLARDCQASKSPCAVSAYVVVARTQVHLYHPYGHCHSVAIVVVLVYVTLLQQL